MLAVHSGCMTKNTSIQTIALALNATADAVPEWIQLTPAGPAIEGRDGRRWNLSEPETVVAAFREYAADLPVDFEHATHIKGEKGEPAPAVGWIKDLEVRSGAIWARVEWTEEGARVVASKGYRYVSPVFKYRPTGQISTMVSAGLTNQPNLKLTALNKQDVEGGNQEEPAMNKAIFEALGLTEGASDDAVLTAINTLKTDEATARNRAETPDPQKFVPRADLDLAMNKIKGFEDADKARADAAITSAVDAAISAGKIAPAGRDFHVAACRADGGLELFQKMVDGMPEIAAPSGLDKDRPDTQTAANKMSLTDEELATCRALGMSAEDFAAAKAEEKQE